MSKRLPIGLLIRDASRPAVVGRICGGAAKSYHVRTADGTRRNVFVGDAEPLSPFWKRRLEVCDGKTEADRAAV